MSSCIVHRLAPPDTPEHLLQLRIRESGLTIDTMESLPGPEDVVRSKLAGVPAKSALEEALHREEDAAIDIDTRGDDDDDDIMTYEDGEDDNLSYFLVEVDDDSDSEFDGEGGDGDFEEENDDGY